MINQDEINKSDYVLYNKETYILKSIIALENNGYNVNRKKILTLSIIQMIKHCYDNIELLNDKQIDNLSNICINI